MATKKKAAKKKAGKKKIAKSKVSALSSISLLRFNPRWFIDPPPEPFRNLDIAVRKQFDQLKRDFIKNVNTILKGG